MSYLVNLDVRNRPVLVVGAGEVAARKIRALVEAGARVTVIAPAVCDQVDVLARAGSVHVERRPYHIGDADGTFVVIAATNRDDVNCQVAEDAGRLGALVNVVDRPALGHFTMPAVVRRGDLTLAVATEGRCPSFSRVVREQLERQFGVEYGEAVSQLATLRERLMADGWSHARIHAAVSAAVYGGLVNALADGDSDRVATIVETAIRQTGSGPRPRLESSH